MKQNANKNKLLNNINVPVEELFKLLEERKKVLLVINNDLNSKYIQGQIDCVRIIGEEIRQTFHLPAANVIVKKG